MIIASLGIIRRKMLKVKLTFAFFEKSFDFFSCFANADRNFSRSFADTETGKNLIQNIRRGIFAGDRTQ